MSESLYLLILPPLTPDNSRKLYVLSFARGITAWFPSVLTGPLPHYRPKNADRMLIPTLSVSVEPVEMLCAESVDALAPGPGI